MRKNVVQEKSFQFALDTVQIYQRLTKLNEYVLSKQLLRAGTSIGPNVEEANAAQSRRDFLSKMSIASKEARATRYWLRLLQASKITQLDFAPLLQQIEELIRILTSIVKTTAERP